MLHWAYRDELPKTAIGGLTGWEKLILLGTVIDEPRGDDHFPATLGAPHPDAEMLDSRVRRLQDVTMLWDDVCEDLMGELAPWAPANDPVLRRMPFQPGALVMTHAKMGTRPRWDLGPARVTRILGRN